MGKTRKGTTSRRAFMETAGKGLVAASVLRGFPAIVPSSVLGATAPGNMIKNDADANAMLSRPQRAPYGIDGV